MIYHEFLSDYPRELETTWASEGQGITHDEHNWFISQRYKIWKFPIATHDLNQPVRLDAALPGEDTHLNDKVSQADKQKGIECRAIPRDLYDQGYRHIGDIDHYKGFIFAPLEYKEHKKPAKIAMFRASDLTLCQSISLAENRDNHHAGWCAVNPKDNCLYTSDYDDVTCLSVYKIEISNKGEIVGLSFLKSIPLLDGKGQKMQVNAIQGGAFSPHSGLLYLSSHSGPVMGGIYVFDTETCKLNTHIQVDYAPSFPYKEEIEGLTVWDVKSSPEKSKPGLAKITGQLHLFMVDLDANADDSYLKHFRIPDEALQPLPTDDEQSLQVHLPDDKLMHIYTGIVHGNFRGYVRKRYLEDNPLVIENVRNEWFSFEISFTVGGPLPRERLLKASAGLHLTAVSNKNGAVYAGWSVRNVKTAWDPVSQKIKVSAIAEVRDTDGYLNSFSYRVMAYYRK